jgi:hypothetical protein
MSLPEPLSLEELRAAIDSVPNEGLLRELLRLTHLMHEAKTQHDSKRLRGQRDLVEGEILRRMIEGHA